MVLGVLCQLRLGLSHGMLQLKIMWKLERIPLKVWFRFGITLFVVGGLYFVVLRPFIFKDPSSKQVSVQPVTTLHTDLQQHYIALSSLLLIDGSDKGIGFQIEYVLSSINSTKLESEKQTKHDIQAVALLSREREVVDAYHTAYNSLNKLLAYTIEGDLGGVNPDKEADEIATRSANAVTALENIRTTNRIISDTTLLKLQSAIDCLDTINSSAKNKESSLLPARITSCDQTYTQLRIAAVNDLTALLNTGSNKQFFDDFANYFRSTR